MKLHYLFAALLTLASVAAYPQVIILEDSTPARTVVYDPARTAGREDAYVYGYDDGYRDGYTDGRATRSGPWNRYRGGCDDDCCDRDCRRDRCDDDCYDRYVTPTYLSSYSRAYYYTYPRYYTVPTYNYNYRSSWYY